MYKKKNKRVNARQAIGSEMAAKRHRFYKTGAPVSLALLLGFVVLATFVLSIEVKPADVNQTAGGIRWWPAFDHFTLTAGQLLLISLVMGLYISVFEPKLLKDHWSGLNLLLSLLVMLFIARLASLRAVPTYLMVVPTMIIGIMLTIAYSQRLALGVGSFFVVLCSLAMIEGHVFADRALGVLLTCGVGTGFVVLLLRDIRTRSRLLEICSVGALAVFTMAMIEGFMQELPRRQVLVESSWAAAGAVSVGFLMQGLLPLVERLFRTATGMTLLDFGEQTNPLLKRLAVEAPGTFNHSWQIGMLADAAAESIGANGLLCRVGAYYHDVGKLNKPRYFVENQAEAFNQHEELSPTMSRMIIVGHVKDGLELAREYHIPKVLHQFIETHHGTTLVEYFYHAANKQSEALGQTVPESEFRYPGPRPQSKEAAIVMLADAVEGATRAVAEPTPSRIEALVRNIAMKRLQDGQFDECDLTMRDLQRIEASLTKSLCGMYHGRIAYPKSDQESRLQLRERGKAQLASR